MINKLIRYSKILITISFNNFKKNYLNTLILRFKNPKLRIGRFFSLKLSNNFSFLTNSNEIYDNVNIEILKNGVLNLRKASWIGANVTIIANNISFGKYSAVHSLGTLIGDISIGDYVMIAKNVFISSGTHHYNEMPYLPIKMQDKIFEDENGYVSFPVTIEDDVWIGVNCAIMAGVNIGKGAIVGSNSVVTQDILPYTVVAGVPAKEIKKRYDFTPPKSINASEMTDYPYFYSGFNIEKIPFTVLDKPEYLQVVSKFSVSLNIENEKNIYIDIKTLKDKLILQHNSQTQVINNNFQVIKFKIEKENYGNSILFFIPNSNIILDDIKFLIKRVWIDND